MSGMKARLQEVRNAVKHICFTEVLLTERYTVEPQRGPQRTAWSLSAVS